LLILKHTSESVHIHAHGQVAFTSDFAGFPQADRGRHESSKA